MQMPIYIYIYREREMYYQTYYTVLCIQYTTIMMHACRPNVTCRQACISPGRPQHCHVLFTPLPGMNRHVRLQRVIWATAAFHLHTPKLAGPGRDI